MGNESSTPVDESVLPNTLYARNIDAVAKYMKDRDVKRIVVMVSHSSYLGSSLIPYRLVLASVHQQEFQISDLRTPVCTPISHD